MKPGDGRALFTAECSHSFHFNCIASYVKHCIQICPICKGKWRDIPFQGPTSCLSRKRARINSVGWLPQVNATPTKLPRVPTYSTSNFQSPTSNLSHGRERTNPLVWSQSNAAHNLLPTHYAAHNSNRHITSHFQAFEPCLFNDDDSLGSQPELPSNNSYIRSIDIKTYPEFSAVQRSTPKENFAVLINLKAHVTNSDQANNAHISQTCRAPIDLVTVLDVSNSMEGTKIELLKRAMGFVIKNLGSSDRLSVIAFSSTAHRLLPLRRMTDSGKQHALQAVNSLFASVRTNILEGLRMGAKVIEDRREKNPVCSIMLLSDGQDTYSNIGYLKQDFWLRIPVHTFGFGVDHDPVLLHSISEACRGTFSFIETECVIQDAFAQCIGGLLSVVVQDFQAVHPDLRLGQLKAGSYSTRVVNDNRTGFIDVGDLYADEERDFLVLVNIPVVGNSSSETKLVNVWCVYKDPLSKETMETDVKEVRIQRPEILSEECVVVSIEVDRQRNRLQAAEAMADSRAAAERGDLSSAWSILDSCRRGLSDSASSRAGDQLCVALDAELKEIRARMANMQIYESSGRAYVLSGMSSHSGQRATARGDSTDSTSFVHVYQTPSMVDMLTRSQASSWSTM
ncbi:von Willebrand factor [Macleaya cordata]|uniref:von Willebrand factor n=1 Tax=Macleaya cordata TaxID=56857 RepID=A0A200RC61_MACCD|nr:von Willebrand factor [Macleaya cordata]